MRRGGGGNSRGWDKDEDRRRRPGWRQVDQRPRRRRASPDRDHDRRGERHVYRDYVPRHGYKGHPPRHRSLCAHREGGVNGNYEMPPAYMLPDHPSNMGQPMRPAIRKDCKFLGGDRSIEKESSFLEDGGLSRVDTPGLGRHNLLFFDPVPSLPPPPTPLYPAVPSAGAGHVTGSWAIHDRDVLRDHEHLPNPYVEGEKPSVPFAEAGYLRGASAVMAEGAFGGESARAIHDCNVLQDHAHLHDPHVEREMEKVYPRRVAPLRPDVSSSTQLRLSSGPYSPALVRDQSCVVLGGHCHEPSNGYAIQGLGRFSHDLVGQGGGGQRFVDKPLGHGSGHDEIVAPATTRQIHSVHPPRVTYMEYNVHGYGRRDTGIYIAPKDTCGNVLQGSMANIGDRVGSSSFTGLQDERIDQQMSSSQKMMVQESSVHDVHPDKKHNVHHSFHGDAATQFCKPGHMHEDCTHTPGTGHLRLPGGSVCRHETASFDEGYGVGGQDISPTDYGGRRSQSHAYYDDEMDMHQTDVSPPIREYYEDEMVACDLTPERTPGRECAMVDNDSGYDARNASGLTMFSRIHWPNDVNEEWADEDQGSHLHSNRFAHGCLKHNKISDRLSRPAALWQCGESSMRQRREWMRSGEKRLGPPFPQFHGRCTSERDDFVRPNKLLKWSDNKGNGPGANHRDAPEGEDLLMKKDPPEGSEEFKMQVHEAFLRFSKTLNESPNGKKRYCEAQQGSLLCCVCGSTSKRFPHIDALISHTYDTCKVGLKTKHLGLHKALCVMMGWNWNIAPDTSKAYHSIPAEEVKAVKEDLILWPPLVIMRNSSIGNESAATGSMILSIEEIEGVLRDIGVEAGKAKVSHGRPANQSVFLVKFVPTFSGLQEAKKIHEYFASRNHGKEEFQQLKGGKANIDAPVGKVQELLYVHIAVAEDMVCLDEKTNKICLVKSEKDIEAIVDACLSLTHKTIK